MKRTIITAGLALALLAPAAPAIGTQTVPTSVQTVSVSAETVAQRNARRMAKAYLGYTAFSRKGLIHQLKYEGFSTRVAAYGVDATHTSWKRQAARMAAAYLDYTAFSRSGLIHQLKFEGFTTAQATYGANKVGL